MQVDQATSWLDQLYGDGDDFELVAIKDGKAHRKLYTWGVVDGGAVVEAMQKSEAGGWNVYASAMPRQQQLSGQYDRVWIDQDDLDAPYPWGTDPDLQWPLPSTLVKTSEEGGSFRWQAIWLLDELMEEDAARGLMRRLSVLIGADTKVSDPRRILRVPGLINAKRGVPARYMSGHAERTSIKSFNLPAESIVANLMEAQVRSPAAILGEWLDGFGEGERNAKAYICARFLRSCGVSHDDALSIVALGGSRCQPAMDEQEIYNAVRSAYHAG